jgi:hypothetical protein
MTDKTYFSGHVTRLKKSSKEELELCHHPRHAKTFPLDGILPTRFLLMTL